MQRFRVPAPGSKGSAGRVYAIQASPGIVAATIIGIFAFQAAPDALQTVFIALIPIGAVGLDLATKQLSATTPKPSRDTIS
ncbi:hypothetical protein [Qipengyuania spongiae]|uniref:Uncharacterized protein n=1 Tax=Qipengyuania spongiae TaxID=2909673 RepID=A0ABY5SZB2_9SPHN|nr:hypothetical protein [Qipengyuania spongiae]UVI38559.1 hypothetical protein L1F33_09880 [Qipengyuania spongiae]